MGELGRERERRRAIGEVGESDKALIGTIRGG